jgi:predicted dehydrogenase
MKLLAALLFALAAAAPRLAAADTQTYQHDGHAVEIRTTGTVTLDPASDAIFDLHGDGTLRVREKHGHHVRVLTARSRGVSYQVDGARHAYDDDAKAWLRRVLANEPAPPTPPPPPPR